MAIAVAEFLGFRGPEQRNNNGDSHGFSLQIGEYQQAVPYNILMPLARAEKRNQEQVVEKPRFRAEKAAGNCLPSPAPAG